MDAPKMGGLLSSQRNVIILAVIVVALPLSYFVYSDYASKSRALSTVEQPLMRAEQLAADKQYIQARDYLDRAEGAHLGLKLRSDRWVKLGDRISTLNNRISLEEPPYVYRGHMDEAQKHFEAGMFEKAERSLYLARETAKLYNLYTEPKYGLNRAQFEALETKVKDGLRVVRFKIIAREAQEYYEKNKYGEAWRRLQEAGSLEITDPPAKSDYEQAKQVVESLTAELKALVDRKKDSGFVLLEDSWVPIKDHALNRLRYMRSYTIDVEGSEKEQEVLKDIISRIFSAIQGGIRYLPEGTDNEGKQADMVLRVANVDIETRGGALGSYKSSATFAFYEPQYDVNIWRFRASINSDTFNFGLADKGDDQETTAMKNLVRDTFYKDFFKDLTLELRKKTNQDFAAYQKD